MHGFGISSCSCCEIMSSRTVRCTIWVTVQPCSKTKHFSAYLPINYSRNADAKPTARTKPSSKPKRLSPTFHLFFFGPSRYPSLKVRLSRLPGPPTLCQAPNLHRHWPVKRPPSPVSSQESAPHPAAQITRRRGAAAQPQT